MRHVTICFALLTTACSLSTSDTDFTCVVDNACAEYRAIDADAANELKAQCLQGASDGLNCDGYRYVCHHTGTTADACTYTDDPYADEACVASSGDPNGCPF